MTPEACLKIHWGYDTFRPLQKDIVTSICAGHDTVALLPTGGGKSICFQVPGLLLPGVCIVISPLISLMKDQVDALLAKNIRATYLAKTLPRTEINKRITFLRQGKYKFLYVSPERLLTASFLKILLQLNISLVVVDEAHCVSMWGNDFRPEYKRITKFVRLLQPRPIVSAFTATATPATVQDIVCSLQLNRPKHFQASFARNIMISILKPATPSVHELSLFAYLKRNHLKHGIIYTSSREETERLVQRLQLLQPLLHCGTVDYYHAGMNAQCRQRTQQSFLENKIHILVATTAFGMGIDKPNIGFVVHYHVPASIESYFQEIGRAGRDGSKAEALLLFLPKHLAIHQSLMKKLPTMTARISYLKKLTDMISLVETQACRSKHVLNYFGELSENCKNCDNCGGSENVLLNQLNNSECVQSLVQWRLNQAKTLHVPVQSVLTNTQLAYMALLQPTNMQELPLIPGIGTGWLQRWGRDFDVKWYNTPTENCITYRDSV